MFIALGIFLILLGVILIVVYAIRERLEIKEMFKRKSKRKGNKQESSPKDKVESEDDKMEKRRSRKILEKLDEDLENVPFWILDKETYKDKKKKKAKKEIDEIIAMEEAVLGQEKVAQSTSLEMQKEELERKNNILELKKESLKLQRELKREEKISKGEYDVIEEQKGRAKKKIEVEKIRRWENQEIEIMSCEEELDTDQKIRNVFQEKIQIVMDDESLSKEEKQRKIEELEDKMNTQLAGR